MPSKDALSAAANAFSVVALVYVVFKDGTKAFGVIENFCNARHDVSNRLHKMNLLMQIIGSAKSYLQRHGDSSFAREGGMLHHELGTTIQTCANHIQDHLDFLYGLDIKFDDSACTAFTKRCWWSLSQRKVKEADERLAEYIRYMTLAFGMQGRHNDISSKKAIDALHLRVKEFQERLDHIEIFNTRVIGIQERTKPELEDVAKTRRDNNPRLQSVTGPAQASGTVWLAEGPVIKHDGSENPLKILADVGSTELNISCADEAKGQTREKHPSSSDRESKNVSTLQRSGGGGKLSAWSNEGCLPSSEPVLEAISNIWGDETESLWVDSSKAAELGPEQRMAPSPTDMEGWEVVSDFPHFSS